MKLLQKANILRQVNAVNKEKDPCGMVSKPCSRHHRSTQ
jgi:hypothetical protein